MHAVSFNKADHLCCFCLLSILSASMLAWLSTRHRQREPERAYVPARFLSGRGEEDKVSHPVALHHVQLQKANKVWGASSLPLLAAFQLSLWKRLGAFFCPHRSALMTPLRAKKKKREGVPTLDIISFQGFNEAMFWPLSILCCICVQPGLAVKHDFSASLLEARIQFKDDTSVKYL